MFIRLSTVLFSVVALAGVAIAAPAEPELEARAGTTGISQCNTGDMHCCDTTYESSSYFVANLFGLIGLPPPPSSSQVGISCSPTTIGGTGTGSSCTQQPVCCTGNSFNGVINVGCSPITINA